VSRGTDRSKGFGAGGALEVSDVRLVEDGSERGGAVVSDVVVFETMSEGWERAQACQRTLTQKQTLWGGGALQVGDMRLLEDGGERGGTLVSDQVASETASEGWGGGGERVGVSMGADRKANTRESVRATGGFHERLQAREWRWLVKCQWALTGKQTLWGSGRT